MRDGLPLRVSRAVKNGLGNEKGFSGLERARLADKIFPRRFSEKIDVEIGRHRERHLADHA